MLPACPRLDELLEARRKMLVAAATPSLKRNRLRRGSKRVGVVEGPDEPLEPLEEDRDAAAWDVEDSATLGTLEAALRAHCGAVEAFGEGG